MVGVDLASAQPLSMKYQRTFIELLAIEVAGTAPAEWRPAAARGSPVTGPPTSMHGWKLVARSPRLSR